MVQPMSMDLTRACEFFGTSVGTARRMIVQGRADGIIHPRIAPGSIGKTLYLTSELEQLLLTATVKE